MSLGPGIATLAERGAQQRHGRLALRIVHRLQHCPVALTRDVMPVEPLFRFERKERTAPQIRAKRFDKLANRILDH